MDKAFVSIVRADRKFYLLATKNEEKQWNVFAWPSLTDGKLYYEKGYERCHNRDYTWSMSATLNWLFFNPSIIELSLDEMDKIVEKPLHVMHLRNMSGYMDGIPLLSEAEAIWESGYKPELINDEMIHIQGA